MENLPIGIEHHQYLIKMEQGKINEKERSEKLTCKCNKFMLGTRLKIKKLLITVNILKYDFPYQTSNNIKTLAFLRLSESLKLCYIKFDIDHDIYL